MIREKKNIIVLIGILLITILLFSKSVSNDFVANWDDNQYVMDNVVVKNLSVENVKFIFSTFYIGNYHPLTLLVLSLEYNYFGDDPMGFHIVNLFFHLINIFLVFIIFQRISGKLLVAAIVALLFGIHPMHVESVSWISGLKDVLYSMFFLWSLWCYLIFIDKKKIQNYIFALILFLFALLSKSMAVTLPVVFILIDYFMSRKPLVKHFSEKIPFFVLSLIFGVLAIMSQSKGVTYEEVTSQFSWIDRVFLFNYAVLFYPFKIFFPFNLSALHYYPIKTAGMLPLYYYFSLFINILIIWGVIRLVKSTNSLGKKLLKHEFPKVVIFGILFYVFTISPVLQVIPVGRAIAAERYSYLPYLALFFIIAQGFYLTWNREYRSSKKIRSYIVLVLTVLVVVSAFSTVKRNEVWKNDVTLFEDMVKKNPDQGYGYYALAKALEDKEEMNIAVVNYDKAIKLDPDFAGAYYNRGNLKLFYYQKYNEAITDLEKAVELDNEFKLAYNNLSIAYTHLRRFDDAEKMLNIAIRIDPDYAQAYFNRGYIYVQKEEYETAVKDLSKAIELQPDYPKAFYQRGLAKQGMSDFQGALKDMLVTKSAYPDNAGLILQVGDVRFELNDLEGACKEWQISAEMGHQIAEKKLEEYCN